MDTTAFGRELQGQFVDTIRKSQDTVTGAVRTWAEAVHSIAPSLPIAPPVPFADQMPKPADLVTNAFGFAEQLLAMERKFAEDILHAIAPVVVFKDGPGMPRKTSPPAK